MGESKHTPGPWAWFGNASSKTIYLATTHSGRRYVMGFRRWGMNGAQPQFQPGGLGFVDARDLLQFEVGDRSVVGHDEALKNGSVYRYDVRGVDCADARLIAAAPDLLDALKALNAYWLAYHPAGPEGDRTHSFGVLSDDTIEIWRKVQSAIAKAEGTARPQPVTDLINSKMGV